MAATRMITQRLASDLVTKPLTSPVFLHLRTTNLPGPDSIMTAYMHNQEGWNAGITDTTLEEDEHDRDPAYQGHESAYLLFCGCL